MKWLELWAKLQVAGAVFGAVCAIVGITWMLIEAWKESKRCNHDVYTRWKNGHSYVKCHKCGKVWED